ncbi:MAG: DNA N-6-adenine-methyltransferase [Hyphomicrobium sp.]
MGKTNEWYTPPHVFKALGCSFDIDVASPGRVVTPWVPAHTFIKAGSLTTAWNGFIWMNPPFGGRNGLVPWLSKFFEHKNGIALVPDRTSAQWWQDFAPRADLILFVAPKLKFIGANGKPGASPAQGTCLLASGQRAIAPLYRARDAGLGSLLAAPCDRTKTISSRTGVRESCPALPSASASRN